LYERVLLNDVKDVAFFPSRDTRSYDAFVVTTCGAGDADSPVSVLRLELATGQVDIVHGKCDS